MSTDANTLSNQIIGAAIEVHRQLGPGLLESAYQKAMEYELGLRCIPYESQKALPILYKGIALGTDYRLDFLIDGKVVVELKSVEQINDVHRAQVLTYLKLAGLNLGLLLNFNVALMKDGIDRLVTGSAQTTPFPGQRIGRRI